jgi:hypothetical protein
MTPRLNEILWSRNRWENIFWRKEFNFFTHNYRHFPYAQNLFVVKRPLKCQGKFWYFSPINKCSTSILSTDLWLLQITAANGHLSDDFTEYVKVNVETKFSLEHPTKAQRGSRSIALLSELDEGGWSTPRPGCFTPRKDPVPTVQEVGWAPGPVLTGAENIASAGVRSPHRPARSESLHRLRYPGSLIEYVRYENNSGKNWDCNTSWTKCVIHLVCCSHVTTIPTLSANENITVLGLKTWMWPRQSLLVFITNPGRKRTLYQHELQTVSHFFCPYSIVAH